MGTRIEQFARGLPIAGKLSHDGVYIRGPSMSSAPDPLRIWEGPQERLALHAQASVILNDSPFRAKAKEQVKLCWLGGPLPINLRGNVAAYDTGATNIAFRFGVDQADKPRARADLRRSTFNLYCTVWPPINLPTWGHISQLCLNVMTSGRKWAFFKADRKAAYKQFPMAPERRQLAMVALRCPTTFE